MSGARRILRINPSDAAPIWRQIEEGVRNLVANGALEAGGAVPSVRELARDLRVNPATVSKAYQRLTAAGVLEVRRGEGTFVARSAPEMSSEERRKRLFEAALSFASLASTLGADGAEASAVVVEAFSSLHQESRGNGGD